jgi:ribosomal protein S18 acetylase RimI-like enzyme
MKHPSAEGVCVRAAMPGDFQPALDLLVASLVAAEPAGQPAAGASYQQQLAGEIGLTDTVADGLFVAERDGQIVGVVALTSRPGRVVQMIAPVVTDRSQDDVVRPLLAAALGSPRAGSARLVQSLLRPEQRFEQAALGEVGFSEGSELLYLLCPQGAFPADQSLIDESDNVEAGADATGRLDFERIDPERVEERHRGVISATYEGSLDCPALEQTRGIEDEIASYHGGGEFTQRRWFLARHDGEDVGCLLLAAPADDRYWEIVYLGLVPAVRGRGWGVQLVRRAQSVAAAAGARGLVLGVDARNTPALDMYDRTGFVRWERRLVYLFTPR